MHRLAYDSKKNSSKNRKIYIFQITFENFEYMDPPFFLYKYNIIAFLYLQTSFAN